MIQFDNIIVSRMCHTALWYVHAEFRLRMRHIVMWIFYTCDLFVCSLRQLVV